MSRIPLLLLVLATWLTVFGQTQFPLLASWLGGPVSILPALTLYASLSHPIGVVSAYCVLASLLLDSLSANRLGASLIPLFACAFLTHARQHLILRDQAYARFWLGVGAGVAVPLLTRMILSLGSRQPISDPFGLDLLLSGAVNGVACPVCFAVFDHLRDLFEYKPIAESSFRADRQIKRGRT